MSIAVIRAKGGTYINRVVATAPIVYFPLNEASGIDAVNRGTLGSSANGTYTGVDLANMAGPKTPFLHPYFDGVNDYVNIDSAALDGGYNGREGTVNIWFKAYNAAFWTDNANHFLFRITRDNTWSNTIVLAKVVAENALGWYYDSNATLDAITSSAYKNTNWQMMSMTWSYSADQMKAYMNGVQVGATQTGLGAWSNGALIAALLASDITPPNGPMAGYLAHAALWNRVLTVTELLALV